MLYTAQIKQKKIKISNFLLRILGLLPLVLFFLLLSNPKLCFLGASNGLLLWFQTLLPTLLPFFIFSGLILKLNLHTSLNRLLYPIIKHLLPISKNGCYPLLLGLLSGLPVGAKTVANLTRSKAISVKEGNYLLSVCNNASPAFLISYVAGKLNQPELGIKLYLLITFSGLLAGSFLRYFGLLKYFSKQTEHQKKTLSQIQSEENISLFSQFEEVILSSFETMVKIGVYVMLFSILAVFLPVLFPSVPFITLLTSLFEMTAGVHLICTAKLSFSVTLLLTTAAVTFTGLSGFAQTYSVIKESGLSFPYYIFAKLFAVGISLLLCRLLMH